MKQPTGVKSQQTTTQQHTVRRVDTFSRRRREELALGVSQPKEKKVTKRARITVTVRKKPLAPNESARGESDVLKVEGKTRITLDEPRKDVTGAPVITSHDFVFDRIYDECCANRKVYNSCVRTLVDSVFQSGKRCSCFAFGQTGSGKTYTMVGPAKVARERKAVAAEDMGLWELASKDMTAWINRPEFSKYELCVSFFEIYVNKVYDLLNERKGVKALETKTPEGVVVRDLQICKATSTEEMLAVIDRGLAARTTGKNSRNNESSRGHVIFTIEVKHVDTASTHGKMVFVDLAGSERGADTVASGRATQQDGAGINRSLLALKECIRAMDQGQPHIPFRDSELTKVLRDLFITESCLTLMIATVSPSTACCEQTLNTLRYAQRVFELRQKSRPCIDESLSSDHSAPQRVASTHGKDVRKKRVPHRHAAPVAAPVTARPPPPKTHKPHSADSSVAGDSWLGEHKSTDTDLVESSDEPEEPPLRVRAAATRKPPSAIHEQEDSEGAGSDSESDKLCLQNSNSSELSGSPSAARPRPSSRPAPKETAAHTRVRRRPAAGRSEPAVVSTGRKTQAAAPQISPFTRNFSTASVRQPKSELSSDGSASSRSSEEPFGDETSVAVPPRTGFSLSQGALERPAARGRPNSHPVNQRVVPAARPAAASPRPKTVSGAPLASPVEPPARGSAGKGSVEASGKLTVADPEIQHLVRQVVPEVAEQVCGRLLSPATLEDIGDDDFKHKEQVHNEQAWDQYNKFLNDQNTVLQDLSNLLLHHVQLSRELDSVDSLTNGRPSVSSGAPLVAKTVGIDRDKIHTVRWIIEKQLGGLIKLGRTLTSVEASLDNCRLLDKEAQKRSMKTIQFYSTHKSPKGGARKLVASPTKKTTERLAANCERV